MDQEDGSRLALNNLWTSDDSFTYKYINIFKPKNPPTIFNMTEGFLIFIKRSFAQPLHRLALQSQIPKSTRNLQQKRLTS